MFKIKFRKDIFSYAVIVTFFSVGLLLLSCRKEKPIDPWNTLPEATQDGANTIGFYANGELFVTSGTRDFLNPLQANNYNWVAYNYSKNLNEDKVANVGCHNISNNWDINLSLMDSLVKINKQIELRPDYFPVDTYFYLGYENSSKIPNSWYRTTDEHFITIKFSNYDVARSSNIVSGTFEGELVNQNGLVLKIKNGRFDITTSEQ